MKSKNSKINTNYKKVLSFSNNTINNVMLFIRRLIISKTEYEEDKENVGYLRQSLVVALAMFITFACGPLFIFGAILFFKQGDIVFGALELFSLAFLVFIILFKYVKLEIRKFIVMLVLYFFSIMILLTTGINGAGMLCVLVIMFLSGILLSSKKLNLFVFINIMTFVVITVLLMSGALDETVMVTYKEIWYMNMLTTQISGIGLLFLTHLIYKSLENQSESIKQSKELIQRSENRYRSIFKNAGLGIFNLSLEGNVTNANIKCTDTLGYSIGELKNIIFQEIVCIEYIELFNSAINELREKKTKYNKLEIKCYKKNGDILFVNITMAFAQNLIGTTSFFICTIEDITEKKKLIEENLNLESHIRSKQRLESIGVLAGGVAHEINNPINGIMNYAQLIYDSASEENEIVEYTSEILHETDRIATIVKNLLQFSRNENQQHSFSNIKDIVESTTSLIKTIIRHDQINFEISIPEGLPDIKCRNQQIQQVIMNLLTNARDSLNEKYKGYDINKILLLSCAQYKKGNQIWIKTTIEDHGIGIHEDIAHKILDPFFTTKGKDKGTGLGLSISYGIVKEHRGELTFESVIGEYTKFYLDLPCDNYWVLESE